MYIGPIKAHVSFQISHIDAYAATAYTQCITIQCSSPGMSFMLVLLLPLGRHWLNISDIVVSGEFREWKEGTTESVVLYPGNKNFAHIKRLSYRSANFIECVHFMNR